MYPEIYDSVKVTLKFEVKVPVSRKDLRSVGQQPTSNWNRQLKAVALLFRYKCYLLKTYCGRTDIS
ncbi:Gag-Pol polyprotein [Schistosoma japonicum]|uniref:Gag-Pol polyprotein n=1 Tax=Schistosoma japonicum TaxID=6182 RepID=A0A4Z2DTX6_SCHJA|nr:Gag-Pol polyprotein [Schistosoma japonicum]